MHYFIRERNVEGKYFCKINTHTAKDLFKINPDFLMLV